MRGIRALWHERSTLGYETEFARKLYTNGRGDEIFVSIVLANRDMNTSILKTELGRTVMLQHNVVSPRPYSRLNSIAGTKGIFADYPERIFLDGEDPADIGQRA